jgi:hypothetical protein
MLHNVFIPYKRTTSDELKFSIKSLKNLPHNDIFVSGDVPEFDGTFFNIPVKPSKSWQRRMSPYHNVEAKIRDFMESGLAGEKFILMNDDFFIMKPVQRLRVYHRGTLKEFLDNHGLNFYSKAVRQTYEYLRAYGIDDPINYELHVPMLFDTESRLSISNDCLPEFRRGKNLLMRSVYGNLMQLGGTFMPDCKNITDYEDKTFLSTNDTSFLNNDIGEYIRRSL